MSPCVEVQSSLQTGCAPARRSQYFAMVSPKTYQNRLQCLEKGGKIRYTTQIDCKECREIKEPKHSFGRGHSQGYNQEYNFRLPGIYDWRQRRISAIGPNSDTRNNYRGYFGRTSNKKLQTTKKHPTESMMMKETHFALQLKIETRTMNWSDNWRQRSRSRTIQ